MIRIRVALTFFAAIVVAFMSAAPAQASTARHVSNGHRYGHHSHHYTHHYTHYTTPRSPRHATPPRTTPPPPPPNSGPTTVFRVDGSRAGGLPVGTSDAAWSQDTHVTLVAQACGGFRCIRVQRVDVSDCGTSSQIIGCGIRFSDGSCTVQVVNTGYADSERAVLEHETGHCLGLGHNTSDPNSIMAPYQQHPPPPGPDSIDRANVRALYP